jgi:hypothetical protein
MLAQRWSAVSYESYHVLYGIKTNNNIEAHNLDVPGSKPGHAMPVIFLLWGVYI